MKTYLMILVCAAAMSTPSAAQEFQPLSADRLAVIAQILTPEFARIEKPPLKIEIDSERAVGKVAGGMAYLLYLDKSATAEAFEKAKEKPVTLA